MKITGYFKDSDTDKLEATVLQSVINGSLESDSAYKLEAIVILYARLDEYTLAQAHELVTRLDSEVKEHKINWSYC